MEGLRAAAKELNMVLGLEPEIDFGISDRQALVAQVLEAATLLENGDEVSAETKKVLDGLKGVEEMKPKAEAKKESKAEAKKESKKKLIDSVSREAKKGKTHLLKELIAGGSLTQREIVAKVMVAFPDSSKGGTVSAICHGKHESGKGIFGAVVRTSKDGKLHF